MQGRSAFQRLPSATGQSLRGGQPREDAGLVSPLRDAPVRFPALTPEAAENFRETAANAVSRDPRGLHVGPGKDSSPKRPAAAPGVANEHQPGSGKRADSKRPDESSSGDSGLNRARAAAEAEVPVRSTGSSATEVRQGESGAAADVVLPEAMSMSQPGRWPPPLSPHASLQNLSPHSSLKPLSPVNSLRGVIYWDDNGKGRSQVLQDVKAFAALQEPNAVSEEDALQGALKYADSIQVRSLCPHFVGCGKRAVSVLGRGPLPTLRPVLERLDVWPWRSWVMCYADNGLNAWF